MKTLLIILMSITFSLGASAQRKGHYYAPRTHIYVVPFSYGVGYGYPYFGSPYFGFPYYGYGYPYREYRSMPYKLTKEIEGIKSDYKYKIKAARKDKTLSRKQRRQEIRSLKSERDKDVINAEMNFRRPGMNNKNYRKNNHNNQKPGTNDPETNDQNQGNGFSSVNNS
jgi:hypothetical protein